MIHTDKWMPMRCQNYLLNQQSETSRVKSSKKLYMPISFHGEWGEETGMISPMMYDFSSCVNWQSLKIVFQVMCTDIIEMS